VRFGDVVENLNETEHNPVEKGIERFIGLEHIEPGSLHIRSWGKVIDGTTFTRCCQSGQVLFGKRRAYQRKVAVAEFDAGVSGDIYVFAPKNNELLPELLPFICMSERFFQHAVGTSAGSLSPRTNWNHLAEFEVDLPPLDQQRHIAKMLWAVDDVIQNQSALVDATKIARQIFFSNIISIGRNAVKMGSIAVWPHWRELMLFEAVEFLDGQRKPIKEADRAKRRGAYPYYGASGVIDIIDYFIFNESLILLGEDGANIVDRSTPLAFRVNGKIWVNNHAHVLRVKQPHSLVYIEYFLESLDYKLFMTGTAQPKLNKSICEKISILVPDSRFQHEVEQRLLAFEDSLHSQSNAIHNSHKLFAALINQFTGKQI